MKFAVIIISLLSVICFAQQPNSSRQLDQLMSQWLDIESQKGRLQSEWNVRKTELERRLDLLDVEQDTLKETLAAGNKSTSEVDERRLTLLKSQNELESAQALLESQLQQTITLAQSLQPRLPPPIQAEWQEKLPALSNPGLNTSEKLEKLLGLFKLVEEFNDRVALHRSTLQVSGADNKPLELFVTQIYLGAAQAWYVSDDGSAYGYGRATPLGWQWWHGDAATAELGRELQPQSILSVRNMLENPTAAKLVALPVKAEKGVQLP